MHKLIMPLNSPKVTSPFGWRNDPFGSGKKYFHQGTDLIDTKLGSKAPIYSMADGTVSYASPLSTYGNVVRVKHLIDGIKYETLYAHLSKINVKVGQKVKQGEQIGVIGTSGNSTGVHVHCELHYNGYWSTGQPLAKDMFDWVDIKNTPSSLQGSATSISTQAKTKDFSKKIGYDLKGGTKAFRIHTDAFKSKNDALKAQKDFVAKGYLKYAEVIGNDNFGYRLQSGKYNSKQDAENASIKMLDAGVIGYASIIGSQQ